MDIYIADCLIIFKWFEYFDSLDLSGYFKELVFLCGQAERT